MRRRFIVRFGDAQGERGAGVFFSSTWKKMNYGILFKTNSQTNTAIYFLVVFIASKAFIRSSHSCISMVAWESW